MAPSISKPASSSSSAKPNYSNLVLHDTMIKVPTFLHRSRWRLSCVVERVVPCPTMFKFGRYALRGRRCTSTNNVSGAATSIVSRYDITSAIMYARQRCIIRRVYPNGFHRNIGSNELIIPQFNRCAFSTRRDNIDMRHCSTAEELVQLAYDHLDTIPHRGKAAFWAALPKLLHQRMTKENFKIQEQLEAILTSTIESISQFSCRDHSTTTLGLAKVMKQVADSWTKSRYC